MRLGCILLSTVLLGTAALTGCGQTKKNTTDTKKTESSSTKESAKEKKGPEIDGLTYESAMDLEYAEDSNCSTDMNVVMAGSANGELRFIEVQGTAEDAPYTRQQLDAMLQLAEQGIAELQRLQLAALAQPSAAPTP